MKIAIDQLRVDGRKFQLADYPWGSSPALFVRAALYLCLGLGSYESYAQKQGDCVPTGTFGRPLWAKVGLPITLIVGAGVLLLAPIV